MRSIEGGQLNTYGAFPIFRHDCCLSRNCSDAVVASNLDLVDEADDGGEPDLAVVRLQPCASSL